MKEKRFSHLDFYFALVLLVFSAVLIIESQKMPKMGQVYVAPGLMPTVIGVILLLQSLVILAGSIKPFLLQRKTRDKAEKLVTPERLRLVITLALLASYIFLLLKFLPYFYATSIFLAVAMWYFKAGAMWKIGLVSLVASGVITFLFGSIFLIPLP